MQRQAQLLENPKASVTFVEPPIQRQKRHVSGKPALFVELSAYAMLQNVSRHTSFKCNCSSDLLQSGSGHTGPPSAHSTYGRTVFIPHIARTHRLLAWCLREVRAVCGGGETTTCDQGRADPAHPTMMHGHPRRRRWRSVVEQIQQNVPHPQSKTAIQ